MLRCSIALASNYTTVVEFLGCSGIFGPCLFGPVVEFLERHRHSVVEFFGQHFNSTIALARRCTPQGDRGAGLSPRLGLPVFAHLRLGPACCA